MTETKQTTETKMRITNINTDKEYVGLQTYHNISLQYMLLQCQVTTTATCFKYSMQKSTAEQAK